MKWRTNVLLTVAGTAVLLGCTQHEVGRAPGGLEPSPGSQQSDETRRSAPGDDEPGARSRGGSNGGGGY